MSKEPRAHGAHELGGVQRSSEGDQWVMGIAAGCSPSPALKASEGAPRAAGATAVPRSSDTKGEGRAAGQVPLHPSGAHTRGLVGGYFFIWV